MGWPAVLLAAVVLLATAMPSTTWAQETLVTFRTAAERPVKELPTGALSWRVESFPSRGEAEAAAGANGLVVETGGTVYLVTLIGAGAPAPRGRVLAEVSPLIRPNAAEYNLVISEMRGPPSGRSAVHDHPGIESYYVIAGEMQLRSISGVTSVRAGEGSPGLPAGTANEVISTGTVDLLALVLFAVDAARPITSPASLPGGSPIAVNAPLVGGVLVLAIVGVGLIILVAVRLGRRSA